MRENPIEKAGNAVGGLAKLASLLGVSIQVVSNWKDRESVPIERCLAIERATNGKVTRRQLRPKDWRDIWPELANPCAKSRAEDCPTSSLEPEGK
jgi:DNA-binding transcriptional regulator YdaS (Cro superfamily)